jgi:protein TonB
MLRIGAFFFLSLVLTIITVSVAVVPASAQGSASAANSSPTQAPLKARVSTGVMLGLVEHKTMPVYPDEAMSKGIEGDVIFKIEVDETGKITSSVPVGDSDPLLLAASKDALRTFKFRPFLLNGTPAKVQTQLGFHFSVKKTADGAGGNVECLTSIPRRS